MRGKIESAMSNVESAIKGDDKTAIERALGELESSRMELGKAIYAAQAAAGGSPGAGGGPGPTEGDPRASAGGKKDDVIDAEFEVKDEKR